MQDDLAGNQVLVNQVQDQLVGHFLHDQAGFFVVIRFHQHLPGADTVPQIHMTGNDLPAGLEGQAAFVFSPHLAGIHRGAVHRLSPHGNGADHRYRTAFNSGRLHGLVSAPADKSRHCNPKQDVMGFCQFYFR